MKSSTNVCFFFFFFLCLFLLVVCEIRPVPAKDILELGSGRHQHNDGERRFVLALDFKGKSISKPNDEFYSMLRESVASALNKKLLSSEVHGHRVRGGRLDESGKGEREYTREDVVVIGVSPVPATHANLRITICVHGKGGHLSSADDVRKAISKEQKSISHRVGLPLLSVSEDTSSRKGRRVPRADDNSATNAQERQDNIWEAHRWLFIAIIIFIGFSILLTIICCICLKCRRKSSARNKGQGEVKEEPNQVTSSLSPGLMQEQSPLNEPPPIDEENGWIIPLDQMTKEELEQPEVQVSRL